MKKPSISLVIPVYNEEGNISPFFQELKKWVPSQYNPEYIFVDDGSYDNTLNEIKKLSKKHESIKYLSFTRNFGHQYALKAGIDHAKGKAVISLDGDFQHPPHIIPLMIEKWAKGNYKIVYTERTNGGNLSWFKKHTSRLFYKLINSMSESQIGLGRADFRLLDRKVVDLIIKSTESTLFLRGLVAWTGHKNICIPYEQDVRVWGKSKYTYSKMLKLAVDAITSFTTFPLRIASIVGLVMSISSGLYGLYAIITWISNREVILGWSSVIVSILFIGGIQLLILGIVGEYIGKIFLETKNRPLYLIGESKL